MFGDPLWDERRTELQQQRYESWWECAQRSAHAAHASEGLVVLEFGAGTYVPTVRLQSELAVKRWNRSAAGGRATLVRVNPRDSVIPHSMLRAGHAISISTGAMSFCEALAEGGDALV
jgi:hypothetical protein